MPNNLKIPIISKCIHFIGDDALKNKKHIHKSSYFIVEGSEVGEVCYNFCEFLLAYPFLLLHMPKNMFQED